MSENLKGLLYLNISSLYYLKNDMTKAKLYQQTSQQVSAKSNMMHAINLNNLTVMELKSKNYALALDLAKKAITLIETDVINALQHGRNHRIEEEAKVLIVSYFNYSQCKNKMNEDPSKILRQALKLGQ